MKLFINAVVFNANEFPSIRIFKLSRYIGKGLFLNIGARLFSFDISETIPAYCNLGDDVIVRLNFANVEAELPEYILAHR
jgi:hypothetical protein